MRRAELILLAVLVLAGVSPARAQDSGKPVATVNGKALSELEFYRRCERKVGGTSDTAIGFVVIQDWIDEVIAEEEATRRKVLPTDEDVSRRLDAVRKMFEFRGDSFEPWLKNHGRSLDTLREEIRRQLIVEKLLTGTVTVNVGELEKYYADNKNDLGLPEQIRVSVITADDKKAADVIEGRLKKGAPFETVAKDLSRDQFAKQGGRVPFPVVANVKVQGVLEPPVLERALKLPVGKTSDAIAVEGDYVFVRLEERLPARAPALADVADLLLSDLRVKIAGPEGLQKAKEQMQRVVAAAKIDVMRPEYRPLLKRYEIKLQEGAN
jgi:foldase protein PrsA